MYSGQTVELREVVLKNKPSQMLVVSPKATVPVLIVQDGDGQTVLDESLEIMQWALGQHDPEDWLGVLQKSLTEDELIAEHDLEFKPLLDRYKYFDRFPEKTQEEHLNAAIPFLKKLDRKIALDGSGLFLARTNYSVYDAAIFPFIRQFAHSDLNKFSQLGLPNLQSWLASCIEQSLFKNIMAKYKPWDHNLANAVQFG